MWTSLNELRKNAVFHDKMQLRFNAFHTQEDKSYLHFDKRISKPKTDSVYMNVLFQRSSVKEMHQAFEEMHFVYILFVVWISKYLKKP